MKNRRHLKSIVLSMALAAMMLPAGATAQENPGESAGLFGKGGTFGSNGTGGLFDFAEQEGEEEAGITNQGIGEPAPLGSGLFILLGAGLGYVALKRKEDEQ